MSKTRKLTIKQKKFVDKVLETGNATEAALEAYNTTTN
jgi:phage terminase small subunit